MNVFVLTTGRTASTSFMKACNYLTNYTSGHETLCRMVGDERLMYPENHIEVDNRLSFHLGGLDKKYGNDALYVHLLRDPNKVAKSYNQRWHGFHSIMTGFTQSIKYLKVKNLTEVQKYDLCAEYIKVTNDNIDLFLKDKNKSIKINVENIAEDFKIFWNFINGEGDIEGALKEFKVKYNSTDLNLIEDQKIRKKEINEKSILFKLKRWLKLF